MSVNNPNGQILIYTNDNNQAQVSVTIVNGNVWYNTAQLSDLFQTPIDIIEGHIKNILICGVFFECQCHKTLSCTDTDGSVNIHDYYDLEVITDLVYRIDSKQALKFKKWSTRTLCGHINSKGITLEEIFKEPIMH